MVDTGLSTFRCERNEERIEDVKQGVASLAERVDKTVETIGTRITAVERWQWKAAGAIGGAAGLLSFLGAALAVLVFKP